MTTLTDPVLAMHPDATLRAVANEGVILMVTTGQMYTCNETAIDMLSRLDGEATLGQITEAMAGEYDVTAETLRADMQEILDYLRAQGVVVEAG